MRNAVRAVWFTSFLTTTAFAGDGIWMRNAVLAESPTFDACNAHQPGNGEYHYHDNPVCLRLQLNDNIEKTGGQYRETKAPWRHSPILGWAYDGYPIYGPYGYSDARNAASPIARMKSGFRLRSLKQRRTLAQWSAALHGVAPELKETQYGPDVDEDYPLGWYVEDFEYAAGNGSLDIYNGRFAVTPEFPSGTYAYFVTVDETGKPAFPYVLGRQYYGNAVPGRTRQVEDGAKEYFASSAESDPLLTSWLTKYSKEDALVINGRDPQAGPKNTWPGQTTPTRADVQRVSYSPDWVYIQSTNLASHVMGPWYEPHGGVFRNWPRDQHVLDRFTRHPQTAETKAANYLGPLGRWVNGVAVFNMLDGASWSQAAQDDVNMRPPFRREE